jgi:serine/threonine protein kinase
MQAQQFGKYLLLEKIAVGGMAEVFKAKITGVEGFEKLIAIKRILPNISEDQEFVTMFTDEAKIAGELSHANIAQIFDLGRVDNIYFIAMEYIHGKDLRTIWERHHRRGRKMPIPMSAYIMSRVCEGLDYAHRKKNAAGRELNIIHRDVSPQNILVSYDGEVKIIDFGIAKAANKVSKTQAGILKGKFGYMSPEQVRGLALDRRSDIFSAGIVLYELICGERLFVGGSDFSTLEKIRKVEILPPSTINQEISPELERIILKALAKDPADRYQWAYQMQEELQAYLIKSGHNFSRKDLANYLKQAFRRDIEQELERNKEFEKIRVETMVTPIEPSITEVQTVPESKPAETAADDDEEEAETVIWDPRVAQRESPPKKVTIPATPSRIPSRPPPLRQTPPRLPAVPPQSGAREGMEDETLEEIKRPSAQQLFIDETPEEKKPSGAAPFVEDTPEEFKDQTWSDAGASSASAGRSRWWLAALAILLLLAGGLATIVYLRGQGMLGGGAQIAFEITPADAVVYFDGRPGAKNLAGIKPGEHLVEVTAPNYQPFRERIKLNPGEKKQFPVSLQFIAGTLVLEYSPAEARVKLDGQKIDGSSPLRLQLVPGKEHLIELDHPAYRSESLEISLGPRQEVRRQLALKEKTYELRVSSNPKGARVVLDGRALGTTPFEIKGVGASSPHHLVLEKAGYSAWATTLVYDGNDLRQIAIELEKTPSASQESPHQPPRNKPAKGILPVNSVPWGRLIVDGRDTGKWTPMPRLELEEGVHTITIRFDDGTEKTRRVEVKAGKENTPEIIRKDE